MTRHEYFKLRRETARRLGISEAEVARMWQKKSIETRRAAAKKKRDEELAKIGKTSGEKLWHCDPANDRLREFLDK